jgi:hypothetical protein
MKTTRFLIAILAAVCGGLLLYLQRGRRHVLNWGATPAEVAASLPGDDLLDNVALQTTRATTVNAPPEAVWPWIVQMGPSPRAGVYTYDWVERMLGIDIRNSDRILPEYQHLEPGEFFRLNPKADASKANGLIVRQVEPGHSLVLQWTPANSTWSFTLNDAGDGTTRLISRNRIPGSGPAFWSGMVLAMEPGSLVMERKMLLGIKQRAERRGSPL